MSFRYYMDETSLFCLAFKIKMRLFTDCFYWLMCTCKPFKCERFCFNVDHEKIPYKAGEEWDHCITFDCDRCAFTDDISQISGELLQNSDNMHQIYYSINKLFVLWHAYVGFGKGNNYLNFLLPCEGSCHCNWDQD